MYSPYMYILLYVIVIWCNGISEIYCQLESGCMYPQYMCILLYMTLIWCNNLFGVNVHSAICVTYLV